MVAILSYFQGFRSASRSKSSSQVTVHILTLVGRLRIKSVRQSSRAFLIHIVVSNPSVFVKIPFICVELRRLTSTLYQAHTLSSIANCDWPDEYPDILSALINLLSSGSPVSIHGAMQVFTEFIKADLTEDQILPVLRQLLPVLLSILGATDVGAFKFSNSSARHAQLLFHSHTPL